MRKTILIISLCIINLISIRASAQIGLEGAYIRRAGELSDVFSPMSGGELILGASSWMTKVKFSIRLGYYQLASMKDSLPLNTVGNRLGRNPSDGYEVINNYSVFNIGFSLDSKFFKRSFYPTFGFAFYYYYTFFDIRFEIFGHSGGREINNSIVFAVVPKVGCTYEIDDFLFLTAGLGRSMGIEAPSDRHQHNWKLYFNTCYYFR